MNSDHKERRIPLTQGKYAIVDAEDFEELSRYKWHFAMGYAARKYRSEKGQTTTHMARMLLGLEIGDPLQADHINHNGLDNRRCNLRIVTVTQNQQNQNSRTGTSRYKGVYFNKRPGRTKPWVAQIKIKAKNTYLGMYAAEIDAAKAYNAAAEKHFGEFAKLNPV